MSHLAAVGRGNDLLSRGLFAVVLYLSELPCVGEQTLRCPLVRFEMSGDETRSEPVSKCALVDGDTVAAAHSSHVTSLRVRRKRVSGAAHVPQM